MNHVRAGLRKGAGILSTTRTGLRKTASGVRQGVRKTLGAVPQQVRGMAQQFANEKMGEAKEHIRKRVVGAALNYGQRALGLSDAQRGQVEGYAKHAAPLVRYYAPQTMNTIFGEADADEPTAEDLKREARRSIEKQKKKVKKKVIRHAKAYYG